MSHPLDQLRKRSLDALEWGSVQNALVERVKSPLGTLLAQTHEPFNTAGPAARLRVRIQEAFSLLGKVHLHNKLAGVTDPKEAFEHAARQGVLTPLELWNCGHFIETLGLVGEDLRQFAQTMPSLCGDFQLAPPVPPLCEKIRSAVNSEGLVLDSASPELARLRSQRSHKKAQFESQLDTKVKDWHSQGLLQDKFYDLVDGRYVVPVKAEQQSKLGGVLMGRSNTGHSVFVEPMELTVANNELKELDLAIRAEEYRILKALSAALTVLVPSASPWIEPLAELDLIFAAALLARDWRLSAPNTETKSLELKGVFHPKLLVLLEQGKDMVTNSYQLPHSGHALLISGPNTGGKTVLLKASARAACMANAGLFCATEKESTVPHYTEVLALIGDEQNINLGLSSFSAQIHDLKAVLQIEQKPMLIIIDEILSSTDPEEASALGQAILEDLLTAGHHILVTTHFGELPARCKADARFKIAAMEFFDGKPTYRLRPDELGSSHALEIASNLGLPQKILQRAKSLVSSSKLEYEKARKALLDKEKLIEAEHDRALQKLEQAQKKLAEEKNALQEKWATQIADFFKKAQETLQQKLDSVSRKTIVNTLQKKAFERESLEEITIQAKQALDQELQQPLEKDNSGALPIEVGSEVRLKKSVPNPKSPLSRGFSGSTGRVLELKEFKGTAKSGTQPVALVQLGNFKIECFLDELEAVKQKPQHGTRYSGAFQSLDKFEANALDLRGIRFEQAIEEASRYLDHGFRSGAATVSIITGHGTGALKKGIKELLKSLPYVKDFKPEHGNDDGCLRIEFDR